MVEDFSTGLLHYMKFDGLKFNGKVRFLMAENSNYANIEDYDRLEDLFPNFKLCKNIP